MFVHVCVTWHTCGDDRNVLGVSSLLPSMWVLGICGIRLLQQILLQAEPSHRPEVELE